MSAAKPGWYPDPAGADASSDRHVGFRWWDGEHWTDAIGSSLAADPPACKRRRTPRPGARVAATLTVAVALVTVLGVVVGLVIWRDPSAGTSGSAATGVGRGQSRTADPGTPTGRLDEPTRLATIQTASMTLPADPYALYDQPMHLAGPMDEFFQANATVHSSYDGQHAWSALVGLAHVRTPPSQLADLELCGAAALRQLAAQFFGGHPTRLRQDGSAEHAVDGRPGVMLTGRVQYRIAGLPSSFDTVTVLLVRLDDGSVVAAFSSVPNDASAELTDLAADSISTLTVR